jgi:hypothetical protein
MSDFSRIGKSVATSAELARYQRLSLRVIFHGALLITGPILFFTEYAAAQSLEKVRIGMPSLSLSFVAPQVAYARGFFREEGIDAEIIRIATNIGIVAVTTKEIGYTTAVGAAQRGQRLTAQSSYLFQRPPAARAGCQA